MAKLDIGILGSVSGLVGTVVGSVFRGEAIIRAKPRKSKKPPTPSQLNQQNKFAATTGFLVNVKDVIDIGYQSYKEVMSPMNAAVQYNLKNAITGIAPDFTVNYPEVQISKGSLAGSNTVEMAAAAGALLNITWAMADEFNDSAQLLRSSDTCVVMIYAEKIDRYMTAIGISTRASGKATIHFPKAYIGDKLHTWVFFVTADGKSVSTSQYLGSPVGLA